MVCKRWAEYRQMLVKKMKLQMFTTTKKREMGERERARARGKIWDDVRFAFVICTFVIFNLSN